MASTIRDVARQAGVSIATVSRAPGVGKKVAERIVTESMAYLGDQIAQLD